MNTKKYIGTKIIEAAPMSANDAEECGFKTGGKVGDGYWVRYEDGYESWSPKDVFEKAYKIADTPLDRLYIEYNELMDKYNKLVLFLGREDAESIAGEMQVGLMDLQKIQMHDYLLTLRTRIEQMKK
ncbi:crAss001_48 related protein [Parabacteroides provencensis]|uniref:crAss001_48 related protein n=1 Tax=Parabacteroides provencensis TaxID=1944636 RepID=UPI000C158269|nr:hypothetical protein [Parabacteroides provencensis]